MATLVATASIGASLAVATSAGAIAPGTGALPGPAVTDAGLCLSVDPVSGEPTPPGSGPLNPADRYSLSNQLADTGAPRYWNDNGPGPRYRGQGIDVAIIDSGVAPVPGLSGADKVVHGPDLSFEAASAFAPGAQDLSHRDTYGHGTHLAGLIAGNDPATGFRGMAPDARIVSLKVADSQGAADVTQVIAAIDWVVQHKNDDGMRIRVLNLAYGLDADPSDRDPLAFAVQQAWDAGIVVVASTGNAGLTSAVESPASTPGILAVGAYDFAGTPGVAADDIATEFTSGAYGRQKKNPDILAPGRSLMSLRVAGSASDEEIAETCRAEIAANGSWSSPIWGADKELVRASGTSQSAAIVSGAVALMLSKNPALTPDDVKQILWKSARQISRVPGEQVVKGKGELNLAAAFDLAAPSRNTNPGQMTGGGRLDDARGTEALPCMTRRSASGNRGDRYRGSYSGGLCSYTYNNGLTSGRMAEVDVFGNFLDTRVHAAKECIDRKTGTYCVGRHGETSPRPWIMTPQGEAWNGTLMTGSGWTVMSGQQAWAGVNWSLNPETALDWLGRPWTAHSWTGAVWEGRVWRTSDLEGRVWRTSDLSGRFWRTGSWMGDSWSGRVWRDHSWR